MDRIHAFDANFAGVAFGVCVFYLLLLLQLRFDAFHYVALAAAAFFAAFAAFLMSLSWRRARSAICHWSAGIGAISLAYAYPYLWVNTSLSVWPAKGLAFLAALCVAIPAGICVSGVVRKAGPRFANGLAWTGRALFMLAMAYRGLEMLMF